MSMIMGVHLLDKLYLISDTRETISYENGQKYKDDLIKAFVFSSKCSAVAAGKTSAASFLLNGILARISDSASIDEVMSIFSKDTKTIISEFVNLTLNHSGEIALIVAGFNDYKGKEVVASRLGEAMSGQLVADGNGSFRKQSINNLVVEGLSEALFLKGSLAGDDVCKIQTLNSKMFSIKIDIRTNNVDIEEIGCYNFVIFHPDQEREVIQFPDSSISFLDFRERDDSFADISIYEDTEHLLSFFNKELIRCGFATVGGHVFPLLQTVVGAVFPTGDISTVRRSKLVKLGSFYVDSVRGISYKFENGENGVYRHLNMVKNYERYIDSII